MKLLVVDDQELIRESVKAFLKWSDGDIKIDEAADGDKAFKIYCKRGPYDLVLTDIAHPGLDGLDLAKAILKKNPAQPLAYATAAGVAGKIAPLGSFANDRWMFLMTGKRQSLPLELKDIPVLGQPYELKQLLALVQTSIKTAHH